MIKDRNKGIDIRYNHLNLPVEVTLPHGGKETYTYSADGTKLRTQYNHDDTTKVKDYCGSWVYEENVLQYTLHSEGRTVRKANTGAWSYEYHIKDHLGNVRVTFRKKDNLDDEMGAGRYSATMETANAAQEDTTFENVAAVRHLDANKARTGTASARLNASENRPLGPSKWLAVSAHDTVVAEAYAHYVQPNTGGNLLTWTSWLSLFAGVGQVSSGEGTFYQQVSPLLGLSLLAPLSGVLWNDNVPKAYLRYAYFDEDSVYLSGGIQQISGAATSSWEALRVGLVAPQDGYVQVWVANESNTNVFFDDISVSATSRYLVEELHYNPWGLELEGLTYSNSAYRYNGKEREARTSFLDYGARRYDKQVGRWWSVDPLAENRNWLSPYNYVQNNPLIRIDPDGMLDEPLHKKVWNWVSNIFNNSDASRTTQSVAASTSYTFVKSEEVRKEYVAKVSSLDKTDSDGRTKAKMDARAKTPAVMREVAEKMRPSSGEKTRVGGTASKTNAGVNDMIGKLGTAGKVAGVASIGISAYNVASAENKPQAISTEGGALIGAITVGEAGAEVGAVVGTALFPAGGGLPGAIVGGIFGSIAGGIIGANTGTAVYNDITKTNEKK